VSGPAPRPGRRAARGLRALVAVALLAAIAWRVDLRAAAALLLATEPLRLGAAALLASAAQGLAAERLRRVARRRDVALDLAGAWRINLAASFYGLALPAGNVTGGFVRLQRLRRAGGGVGDALLVMAADRYLATLSLALAGLLCLPLAAARAPGGAALLLGGAGLALLVVPACWRPLGRFVAVEPLMLSLLAQAAGIASFVCLARAAGIVTPALALGWIRCLTLLVVLLPISIAGLGVREATLVALLAPFGVSAERGIAFALLVFLVATLLPAMAGGALALLDDGPSDTLDRPSLVGSPVGSSVEP
jgi:hypothetical protein